MLHWMNKPTDGLLNKLQLYLHDTLNPNQTNYIMASCAVWIQPNAKKKLEDKTVVPSLENLVLKVSTW